MFVNVSARWRTTYWEQRVKLAGEDHRAVAEPEVVDLTLEALRMKRGRSIKDIILCILWIRYMDLHIMWFKFTKANQSQWGTLMEGKL